MKKKNTPSAWGVYLRVATKEQISKPDSEPPACVNMRGNRPNCKTCYWRERCKGPKDLTILEGVK